MGTSYETLRILLLIRGMALGCALQPTQLVSLAVVPRHLLASASALNNALRNVFQSFGIALLGPVVQSETAYHAATLSQGVTATSAGGQFIGQLGLLFQLRAGLAASAAQTGALMLVIGQVQQQAAVLAFGDAYRFTFFTALLAILLSLLLPGRGQVN